MSRADLIAKRKARARDLAKRRRADMSVNPAALIRHWPGVEPSAVIAGYWPIGSEMDVRPLLERLSETHRIVMPVTPRDRRRLSFRQWTQGCEMESGPFDTRHPVGEPSFGADPLVPDLVLVPMLAYTAEGHRLGYGGGYYDYTLAALKADNPACRTVGVAFADQRVKQLPVEDTDIALDAVLTEEGFRLFGP